MKLFIISLVVVAVAADRLDNTYLPPSSAQTAGGNGNFLNAPSDKYGAPSGQSGRFQAPSTNYGAPVGNSQQGYNNGGQQQQAGPDAGAAILKFDNENNGDGSYRFEYETENKIQHQEAGELKNQGTEQEAQSVSGSYSYMGPDGVTYTVTYIADENGFRATGDHIPTPPPVPEAIQKSLELNAAAEASNNQGYSNGGYQNGNNGNNGNNGYQSNGNNGYQSNNNNNNGYQNNNGNGHHAAPSSASRQYIPPNKPSFNQQNGYQY
ncbi:pupal cuticle protein 20-like [Atheta coriaria]|uniref:pupal cuticle protein 20-like n=1 Tax=Dalotia coriaria TaxID=877792 RepID=UPI0031F45A0F